MLLTKGFFLQNKKRKFDRDRDDREERQKTPEEQEDPLKDATTLYVGNLSVYNGWGIRKRSVAEAGQVIFHHGGADT